VAALICLGSVLMVAPTTAQEPERDANACYGAVISALAARGFQPGDFGDVPALQDQVRAACAALDPAVQRFTVEIDGVSIGGVIIRVVPEN
jgi:hypothetical protein